MDMTKWEEYENKKKALKKSFLKKQIILWVIWVVVTALINTVIILFEPKFGPQITFTVMVFINAFAVFIGFRKSAELKHYLKRQVDMIEQDEPFGKFRS